MVDQTPELVYSPSAIVNLVNNQIVIPQDKSLLRIRGIFSMWSNTNYGWHYRDNLRDETADTTITLVVPGLLRNELTNNQTIDFYGYITHRVEKTGKISILVNISELIGQTENKISDDDIKTFEVLQKKAKLWRRDVDSYIKKSIYEGKTLNIIILIGKNAIVDNDIKHQLQEGISFYNIEFVRANFSSIDKIITKLQDYEAQADIIVLSRWGWEGVDIFSKPDLAQACLELKPYLLSAIGHKDDESLIDKIADKSFSTPTALGQYLNDIYNNAIEELEWSRAKLYKELEAVFKKQIEEKDKVINEKTGLLEAQLKNTQKTIEDKDKVIQEKTGLLEVSNRNMARMESSLSKQWGTSTKTIIAWIAIGVVIGLILMALLK